MMEGTLPPSCTSMAARRCPGRISGFPSRPAMRCASAIASRALTVYFSNFIARLRWGGGLGRKYGARTG